MISNFNIPEQNTSRKIIRASKGIMKELNSDMSSILVDDIEDFELLKILSEKLTSGSFSFEWKSKRCSNNW